MSTPPEDLVDILVRQFAECAELGITIPEGLPLGTAREWRSAVFFLARLIWRKREALDHGEPGTR